jgi:hypothetical protein
VVNTPPARGAVQRWPHASARNARSRAKGVLGPVLVNHIRESQIAHGTPKYEAYNVTMYIMAGLLALAFFANLAIKPVSDRYVEKAGGIPNASPSPA